MLDRTAIVVASRVVLIDRTDPIDAGAGQDKRIAEAEFSRSARMAETQSALTRRGEFASSRGDRPSQASTFIEPVQ
jgi:hypothetical protein